MTFIGDPDKKPKFGSGLGTSRPGGMDQRRQGPGISATLPGRGYGPDYGRDAAVGRGVLIVRSDTMISGEIRNCRLLEVHGYVEGEVTSEVVLVHKDGRLHGTVRTDSAEIHGTLQGHAFVKNLISVRSTGTVNGKVEYGQVAVEPGGILSAEFRNVPPTLAGDFDLQVAKGGSVAITTTDLTAVDPDDVAEDLTYTVSNAANGFIARAGALTTPVKKFTQADIEAGKIFFVHNGSQATRASFDVVVTDAEGADSGAAQTVRVDVKGK